MRICPICKKEYNGYPAISRTDNKTEICSSCGMFEALKVFCENEKERYAVRLEDNSTYTQKAWMPGEC